jgi:hypothetical protein
VIDGSNERVKLPIVKQSLGAKLHVSKRQRIYVGYDYVAAHRVYFRDFGNVSHGANKIIEPHFVVMSGLEIERHLDPEKMIVVKTGILPK